MFFVVVDKPAGVSASEMLRAVLLPASVLGAVVVVGGILAATRSYAHLTRWLYEDRAPSANEARATAAGGLVVGGIVFVCGLVYSTAFVAFASVRFSWLPVLRTWSAAQVVVIGAALLCFLICERSLGPVLATVAHDRRAAPGGIVGRLVVVWAQGAAVPVAALVMAPDKVNLGAVQWSVLGVGLAMSLAGVVVTGRNVSDPLRRLRAAVQEVRSGNLNVEVDPREGGELGQLQNAFNDMVGAMRDRDRLQLLFGRHVGDAVVQRALAGNDTLGGEERDITALFVDIDGSTELARTLPPDEVVVMLNGFYGVVVEVVSEEGGLVNKFEGDAALAIFGAPSDHPDHADRALRAARSLRERLAALSIVFPNLDAGIGVASGSAVAGNIGAADRYEYTVIGDPVNVASRLSDMAQDHPGRVLVGESTIAASAIDHSNWIADGVAELRGRSGDVTVYVPASATPAAKERRPHKLG